MDQGLLLNLLQRSLSANQVDIKAAETQFSQLENQNPGGMLIELLKVVFAGEQAITVRQAAAIYAKNLLKRRWAQTEADASELFPLDGGLKTQVRSVLLEATCGTGAAPLARQIQSQVNAIISYIAKRDFPQDWPELLPSLTRTLSGSPSSELRLNALTVVASVLKKYKTAARSASILKELQYVLGQFAKIHLDLFVSVLPSVLSDSRAKESFSAMYNILDIFASLNVVDIPEYYQDNVGVWMDGFFKMLQSAQHETEEWMQVKTLTCDNLVLYADKYQEVFEPFVRDSVKIVWSLLVSLDTNDTAFDHLVSSGIGFLSSSANTRWENSPFEEQAALTQIVEKLVIPNIQLRDADLELFTDNPDDFIRKDLQSGDAETRRRSAVDLVRALGKFYEEKLTPILLEYVAKLLAEFKGNYRAKDACIQLVTAVAAKGETRATGVSVVNDKIDINQFFASQIAPELAESASAQEEEKSAVKATCLKFLILFRNKISSDLVNSALSNVVSLVDPKAAKVVQCYAAHCLYLLLSIPGIIIAPGIVFPAIQRSLEIISASGEQNEYLMKLVFRLLSHQAGSSPIDSRTVQILVALMGRFAQNPVNAAFTHFLFESIGLLVGSAQDSLVQPLCELLEKNIPEYIPYALQVLSLLIERSAGPSQVFSHLFTLLLSEELWKNVSLIPGLSRILVAYLFKADTYRALIEANLPIVAERFKILVNSVKFEQTAFEIADCTLTSGVDVPPQVLEQLILAVLTKIHLKRSERLLKQFSLMLACTLANPSFQVDQLVAVVEKIQPGIASQVIKDLWMQSLATLNANTLPPKHRKVYFLSIAKILVHPFILNNPALAQAVIAACDSMLCVNPSKGIEAAAAHETTHAEDGHEFEVSYAKLSSTINPVAENDFLPKVDHDGLAAFKHALKLIPTGLIQAHPSLATWSAA